MKVDNPTIFLCFCWTCGAHDRHLLPGLRANGTGSGRFDFAEGDFAEEEMDLSIVRMVTLDLTPWPKTGTPPLSHESRVRLSLT
jgi:hypothetical protein